MRACTWMAIIGALALLGGATAASAFVMDGPLIQSLRQVMAGNFEAYNKKDINALMQGVDSRSPDYPATKAAAEQQFSDNLDVQTKLVDFTPMGHDDEFAVARIKAQTTGKPGSGFADNTVDAIVLFHQENGQWKLWSEDILGITLTP